MTSITRRTAMTAGAALPFAAAAPRLASAGGHAAAGPKTNTFSLGGFTVSTLLAGTRTVTDDPQGIFGMNVSEEEFDTVSRNNFISAEAAQFFFTPTIVNTGNETVLFDTGLNAGGIAAAVEAAGSSAEDVDVVVITHMHGDHIGGLAGDDGTPTFPNARYVTGQAEFDHWSGTDNENFANKVAPLAEKMEFIGDGGSVASGITGMAAFGHTPGHMVYMLESDGEQMVIMADSTNHYVWSLAYPDWEVRFDMDKEAAAATRRRLLGMLAADRIPMIGYHMPFPAMGYVAEGGPDGAAFHYVPATYQFMMDT